MTEPRDVVLVTVDSWRADHCGFMGYERNVTPTLDAIATEGLVFENAIAPSPETNGSVPAIFTGAYTNPDLESDAANYTERTRRHMKTSRTLPQRFSELGYETAAFTANPWTSRYFGFDRDFDHFEDFMDENLSSGLVEGGSDKRGLASDLLAQLLNWYQGQDMFMAWESFYDDVVDWIDDADSPYFLWLFLVDVHMPYFPPDGYRSRSRLLTYPANVSLFAGRYESLFHDVLVDTYDDTIRYTDDFFRRFFADVGDEPLVAITGDHGEAFGENGVYGHGPEISEETLHVPFVVANGPTGTVDRPISLRQLPELLPALATDGSYEPFLEPTVWARNYDPAILVRGTNWRYEWRPEGELLETRSNGEWTPTDDPDLARLGRELVETYVENERERSRLLEATDAVAESAAL
ncbi:sulfatase [Natrialbaceae archaeon AArc-T1-2]|uniref:sulfatase n=1 Tax=Natrialbaceae archaeon AArc-T1-2 TaxID=3053904 RepID=UPI00255AC498|nr:sulfatase [Natrialbaceae archaeon AArc-T1-2]WIV66821.1 sulfatase [Natrialbaceae archaeon AArc-T1-2]